MPDTRAMGWAPAALASLLGLWLLHRLALSLERRGWLFYLHRRSQSSAVGAVLSDLRAVVDPGQRHAVEERAREAHEQDDTGAPPDPWTPSGIR